MPVRLVTCDKCGGLPCYSWCRFHGLTPDQIRAVAFACVASEESLRKYLRPFCTPYAWPYGLGSCEPRMWSPNYEVRCPRYLHTVVMGPEEGEDSASGPYGWEVYTPQDMVDHASGRLSCYNAPYVISGICRDMKCTACGGDEFAIDDHVPCPAPGCNLVHDKSGRCFAHDPWADFVVNWRVRDQIKGDS
jgi:hypothetical protein